MTYKYDFLRFIDSPDIRAHNTRTEFTPAEQAVLISMSVRQTIAAKIEALKWLIDTYSEEEFGAEAVAGSERLKRLRVSFKEVVQNKVNIWEDVIRKMDENSNVVYAAFFNEEGFARDYIGLARFFSTYENAYQYLQECKKEYLLDEDLKDVAVFGRILQLPVDFKEEWRDSNELRYNNELQLVEIRESTRIYYNDSDKYIPDITEAFYVHVPAPWKAGDLVKSVSPYFGNHYGIVRKDYQEKEDDLWVACGIGDASDMVLIMDTYDPTIGYYDYMDAIRVLSVERCTEEEISEYQNMIDAWRLRQEENSTL